MPSYRSGTVPDLVDAVPEQPELGAGAPSADTDSSVCPPHAPATTATTTHTQAPASLAGCGLGRNARTIVSSKLPASSGDGWHRITSRDPRLTPDASPRKAPRSEVGG